ncbi:MAG: hypothetical protein V4598_06220 [Bdellovibrionota bacterium]
MKFFSLLLLATATSAFALETDNYLSWRQELPDSSGDLNSYIQTEIEDVLKSSAGMNCEQVTFKVADRFKTGVRGEVFVNWSTKNISDKIFPSTDHYIEQSIYVETPSPLLKFAPLAPNMQVGGIYFGIDKLSHFASTGRRYFTEYLNQIKKGQTVEEAENSAIHLGLSNEAGILGIWASGVFSYGDLEANYQGLSFYRKFCLNQEDTYLKETEGRWEMVKIPEIKDYVNPYWDETFNLSFNEPRTWKVVSKVLLEEYCPMREKENIVARFSLYKEKAKKSRSMTYIEALQIDQQPQSFEELCQK